MKPFEKQVRMFIHKKLLEKDKYYQRMEFMHMNEVSGVIQVRWIDKEGNTRNDTMQYHTAH